MQRPNNDGKIKSPGEAPKWDLGVRSSALPLVLHDNYYVETDNETEVVSHLTPSVVRYLENLAPAIHAAFGGDCRLMLGSLWRLKEPVGPVLRLFIYTTLEPGAAKDALRLITADARNAPPSGLRLDAISLPAMS